MKTLKFHMNIAGYFYGETARVFDDRKAEAFIAAGYATEVTSTKRAEPAAVAEPAPAPAEVAPVQKQRRAAQPDPIPAAPVAVAVSDDEQVEIVG